jgi:hypothetical protein
MGHKHRFENLNKHGMLILAFLPKMDDINEEKSLFAVISAICCVVVYNSIREHRFNLTRSAILPPSLSPWSKVFNDADEQSFTNLTGYIYIILRVQSFICIFI